MENGTREIMQKGIQPEEVYYFPKVVEYKALWDVDQKLGYTRNSW